jgi:hypothetical protein
MPYLQVMEHAAHRALALDGQKKTLTFVLKRFFKEFGRRERPFEVDLVFHSLSLAKACSQCRQAWSTDIYSSGKPLSIAPFKIISK